MPPELDLSQIRSDTFVAQIDYHEQLDSTNSRAIELAKSDCDTPTLVVAEAQTAGRGRQSNQWWSVEGALTFTLILDFPSLQPVQLSSFSLTTGLAVAQALERFAPAADIALKWPNDVFLNEKKICGILIERPLASEPRLVVGIGINVNNSVADAPAEVSERATSMIDELEIAQDRTHVLLEVLTQLEQRVRDHIHRSDHIMDQYRAYCMLTGRHIEIAVGDDNLIGRCHGVDGNGALLVENEQGVQPCIAGSIIRIQ